MQSFKKKAWILVNNLVILKIICVFVLNISLGFSIFENDFGK